MTLLDNPGAVEARLTEIDEELAEKANDYETAAYLWFTAKRDKEQKHAVEFRKAKSNPELTTVADREAWASESTALIGSEFEARYEAMRAKVRLLESRASIGMAILKSQGRAGA